MGNPAGWLWKKVGGNLLWDAIKGISAWAWGAGMISSGFAIALGLLQGLPWVLLYLFTLYAFLIALMIANEVQRKRIQKKLEQGELLLPPHTEATDSTQQTIPNTLDDTLENAEEKERFRLFTQQVMRSACSRMQWMGYQVQGKIFNGPVTTRDERLLHYSVDAYRFFMQSLENKEEILRDFLAARESLRNDDFLFAQRLFLDLYNVYEHRRPWLRDMAWETFPNVSTYSVYTDWEKADRTMREELIKLRCDCPVLRDRIPDLTFTAPRRWEQGGS